MKQASFEKAENVCLWHRTSAEPISGFPTLDEQLETDNLIIGAGFTGLSTALHLAETGAKVVVLDAEYPGFGASGRNGGQVQTGAKTRPSEILKTFGEVRGRLINAVADQSADFLFSLIKKHRIACDPVEQGLIRGITHPKMLTSARDDVNELAGNGCNVRLADREETRSLIGGGSYFGSIVDKRGGSINPYAYVLGLCKAASRAGVRIYAHSPAISLTRKGDVWQAKTPDGMVYAKKVAICTNGYSGPLMPQLQRTMIPVNSFQIATEPLGNLGEGILPGGQVATETRKLLYYYRRDSEGRLIFGGRGFMSGADNPSRYQFLHAQMISMFPNIVGVRIEAFWTGLVAVTLNHAPHVHEPEPGLHMLVGFNGRGVALTTILGERLARRMLGEPEDVLALPITPVASIPIWRWHRAALPIVTTFYRLRDRFGGV